MDYRVGTSGFSYDEWKGSFTWGQEENGYWVTDGNTYVNQAGLDYSDTSLLIAHEELHHAGWGVTGEEHAEVYDISADCTQLSTG